MSKEEKNINFEYKDEYWLEAKKLLEKEEKKRRFFFWLGGAGFLMAAVALFLFVNTPSTNQSSKAIVAQENVEQKKSSLNRTDNNATSTISDSPVTKNKNTQTTPSISNINNSSLSTNSPTPQSNSARSYSSSTSHHNFELKGKNSNRTPSNNADPQKLIAADAEIAYLNKNTADSKLESNTELINNNTNITLDPLHLKSKTNLLALSNKFDLKIVNQQSTANKIKGNFFVVAAAQTHQQFLQETRNKTSYISARFGLGYQMFVKKNVFINFGLQFNKYQNLHRSASSTNDTEQIQNLNLNALSNNDAGPGTVLLADVNINNNVYTIAGQSYFGSQWVSRKNVISEEIIYAGSLALPINIGVKLNRFSLQAGFTEELILFNKTRQQNLMYIENTALSTSEKFSYNNFSFTPRWLSSATFGLEYNLNQHLLIGFELKQLLHKNYSNKTQNVFLIKYQF